MKDYRYELNPLDYNYLAPDELSPDPTIFRIKASSVSEFIDSTSAWYGENLLGQAGKFITSNGSTVGTVVHYLAEQKINKGKATSADVATAMNYVATLPSDLVDAAYVESTYLPSYHNLKNYLETNPVAIAEVKCTTLIKPGIIAGGSIDAIRIIGEDQVQEDGTRYTNLEQLRGKTVEILDWKTSKAAGTPPRKTTRKYTWQLYTYALVLQREYGINIDKLTNVFITHEDLNRINKDGKRLPPWPSKLSVVSLPFTQENFEFIESIINLITESVDRFVNKPEDRFLLAQDYRLINNTQPLPFIIGEQQEMDI